MNKQEIYISRFDNGQKGTETHYMNDELHGKWTWWLEDGTVEEVLWHDIDSGTHEQLTTESKFKDKYPEFYKEHYETGKE